MGGRAFPDGLGPIHSGISLNSFPCESITPGAVFTYSQSQSTVCACLVLSLFCGGGAGRGGGEYLGLNLGLAQCWVNINALPLSSDASPLTCFLVSTSRMSIRLIMMFLCVFLYFPTRSETVSHPGRPVHMKVLLPCSFHSRTCKDKTQLAPPRIPRGAHNPSFRRRELGEMPLPRHHWRGW